MRFARPGFLLACTLFGCSAFGTSASQQPPEDSGTANDIDGGVVTADPRDPAPFIASPLPSLVLRQGTSSQLVVEVKPAGIAWKVSVSTLEGVSAAEAAADASGKASLELAATPSAPTTVREATVTVQSPSGKSATSKVKLDVRGKAGSVDPSFAGGVGRATGAGNIVTMLSDGSFLVRTSEQLTEFESVPVLKHIFSDGLAAR